MIGLCARVKLLASSLLALLQNLPAVGTSMADESKCSRTQKSNRLPFKLLLPDGGPTRPYLPHLASASRAYGPAEFRRLPGSIEGVPALLPPAWTGCRCLTTKGATTSSSPRAQTPADEALEPLCRLCPRCSMVGGGGRSCGVVSTGRSKSSSLTVCERSKLRRPRCDAHERKLLALLHRPRHAQSVGVGARVETGLVSLYCDERT